MLSPIINIWLLTSVLVSDDLIFPFLDIFFQCRIFFCFFHFVLLGIPSFFKCHVNIFLIFSKRVLLYFCFIITDIIIIAFTFIVISTYIIIISCFIITYIIIFLLLLLILLLFILLLLLILYHSHLNIEKARYLDFLTSKDEKKRDNFFKKWEELGRKLNY